MRLYCEGQNVMCMVMIGSRASEVRRSKARSLVVLQTSLRAMLAAQGGHPIACFVLVVAETAKLVISAGSLLDLSSASHTIFYGSSLDLLHSIVNLCLRARIFMNATG